MWDSRRAARGWLMCGVVALLVLGTGAATPARAADAAVSSPPAAVVTPKPLEPADIIARSRLAVVVVLARNAVGKTVSQGSGFIASPDGLVVTNWHVVADATTALVKRGSGAFCQVQGVVAWDAEHDFAVLRVTGKSLPIVPMGDSDKVRQGDRVLALGAPEGLENTASEGIVSAVRDLPNGQKLLQTTAAISHGSSGGPLFNTRGQVIGITSFMFGEGQSLNFAIPINDVKPKVRSGKATPLAKAGLPSATGSAEALVLQGIRALPKDENAPDATQKYEAALALFRKAAERRRDYADAHFKVGYCLAKLGRYQEAVEAFREAIRLKPDDAMAHCNLGVAYLGLDRYEEAVDAEKEAIRLKPDDAMAHCNLGAAYGKLGRYQEAVESCKDAIRLEPDDAKAHHNLGLTYGNLGRWQEAAQACEQAIRLKPDDAEAHRILGAAYVGLMRLQEAVEAIKQAIRLKPDDAEAHFGLGVAYAGLRRFQDALDAFKEAIRLKPDYANAHFGLGSAHLVLGDRGAALDEYKILKDLDPAGAADLFKRIYP